MASVHPPPQAGDREDAPPALSTKQHLDMGLEMWRRAIPPPPQSTRAVPEVGDTCCILSNPPNMGGSGHGCTGPPCSCPAMAPAEESITPKHVSVIPTLLETGDKALAPERGCGTGTGGFRGDQSPALLPRRQQSERRSKEHFASCDFSTDSPCSVKALSGV